MFLIPMLLFDSHWDLQSWALGWSDFEKNATHSMLCQIVVGPQFQNFISQCCLFPWSQGLRIFRLVPLNQQNKILTNFFQACDKGGTYSLIYSKAKNEEKFKKYLFWPSTDQNSFCPFSEERKKYKTKIFFKFYFFRLFFDVYGRSVQIFLKKY